MSLLWFLTGSASYAQQMRQPTIMTEVVATDARGKTIKMIEFDGLRISSFGNSAEFMKDMFENLPNFTFRDDDIFLASYPKTGCMWTVEILNMLLKGDLTGRCRNQIETMLENKKASSLDALPSPRVLNSHLPVDKLPPDLMKKKIKTVYIIRNYKDIAASFYNFMKALRHFDYDGNWEDWLELFLDGKLLCGDYFTYVRQWEEVIENSYLPVHVLYYEDLKSDTFNELKRLAKFLGVAHSDSFLMEASRCCQFDAMKKKYSNKAVDSFVYKEGTHFYRKGQVGDWKNWFTMAQSETVDELIRTKMSNYKTSIHFGGKYSL